MIELIILKYSGGSLRIVERVASKWKPLGFQLHFRQGTLDNIEKNHTKVEECCQEMFEKWVDVKTTPHPDKVTWSDLVTALRDTSEDYCLFAEKIEKAISERPSS